MGHGQVDGGDDDGARSLARSLAVGPARPGPGQGLLFEAQKHRDDQGTGLALTFGSGLPPPLGSMTLV